METTVVTKKQPLRMPFATNLGENGCKKPGAGFVKLNEKRTSSPKDVSTGNGGS